LTVQLPSSLRLGCVKYLNARPLIHGWTREISFDHPSRLCRMLVEGELDVALVSSFEFLRNPIYSIVDGVSISSAGPVYSVYLAHRGPIEQVEEVGIDPASETSVNLLRCLLTDHYKIAPLFVKRSAQTVTDIVPGRAELFIGDQAIAFRQKFADRFHFLDLGERWQHFMRLPFVYALWLVRPEFRGAVAVANALRAQAAHNLKHLDDLIAEHPQVDPIFCAFYYRQCLRFSFGKQEKKGLHAFGVLCEKHNLLVSHPWQLKLV